MSRPSNSSGRRYRPAARPVHTFSIVACDLDEQAWGIAVASKFLAAGAVVSWASVSAGAVATQAHARVRFGPDGLDLMAKGSSAPEALAALLALDEGAAHRQVALVDVNGEVAAHTGESCYEWAGHRLGVGYSCQGNILTGPETLVAMAEGFETAEGELADRLVASLAAGDLAGGDRRGRQSAAVLVVRPNGGYGGDNDRYLDLRVDDDPDPVTRLGHLVAAHHVFFGDIDPEDLITIDASLAAELKQMMKAAGHLAGPVDGVWDEAARKAFAAFIGNENLEERWSPVDTPDSIDRVSLAYLRGRFSRSPHR